MSDLSESLGCQVHSCVYTCLDGYMLHEHSNGVSLVLVSLTVTS